MKIWRDVAWSRPYVKLPGDGSPGLFQETRRSPEILLLLLPGIRNRNFMPGRNESVGWSKLCHSAVPSGDRMTRHPAFVSVATAPVDGDGEPAVPATTVVAQTTRPLASYKARLEVFVSASFGVEVEAVPVVSGVSRLATHTTVSSGMPLYHIPRYSLAAAGVVELVGEKKPSEKEPSSETMTLPAESGFPRTSRSSGEHVGSERKRSTMTTTVQSEADIFIIRQSAGGEEDIKVRLEDMSEF
ncbi:hypothetical protein U9M48_025222 [Paspalum notatum var. saurae]|uniref:Uncharacterized protein n=1 Tax=Paspalum notatum var. saurae TaxID=547442 RepID=A0AAQ3TQB3_PASNO